MRCITLYSIRLRIILFYLLLLYCTKNSFSIDQNREKQLPISPTGENARILGTDSHKLQLMKASFFDGSDEEINEAYDQGKL